MKKITSICLVFFIGLFFLSGTALAENPTATPTETQSEEASPTVDQSETASDAPTDTPETTSTAFTLTEYSGNVTFTDNTDNAYALALIDANSGLILFSKNIDEKIEPASTTKIMTCLLALESGKLDETVKVSSKAANQGGSLLHIKTGEKIVLRDLINGMMMVSGNDAAVAVAEFLGGSLEGFADMMNAKASELGMTNTHFVVPHGMHAEDHYSTAHDMALLSIYAMKNPDFADIVKQTSYDMPADNSHRSTWKAKNTNKMLDPDEKYYYQYATGIKTGQTKYAKDCLASSATKDNMNLICLVYKATYESSVRWNLSKSLYDWGFENFKTVKLSDIMKKVETVQIPVENAAADDPGNGVLEFAPPNIGDTYITLSKTAAEGLLNGTDTLEAKKTLKSETLTAPVDKGILVGTVTYTSKTTGDVIYTQDLLTTRDVQDAAAVVTNGQTAVVTLAPTPPSKLDDSQPGANYIWLLVIPAGLLVFLVIYFMTKRKGKKKFRKYRKPHYSYKIK